MRIALFGATGGTGRQIVEQGLAAGHSIRALVRDPAKLPPLPPGLAIVQGNVLDPGDVAETVRGTEAAIVALGNTPDNPDMVVSQGTKLIVEAMAAAGVQRLIAVTSLGVGDSKGQVPFVFRILMSTVLRKAMQDKEAQENIIRASDLAWTIVRPGGLTDGPRTDAYRAGTDGSITAGQVSRADVAAFVLAQLVDMTYLRQTPAIT